MLAHRQKATASNARDKLLAAEIVCQFPKCTQPIGDRVYYRVSEIALRFVWAAEVRVTGRSRD